MWLKSVVCSRVLRVFLFERWPTEVSGCNNSSGRSCGRSGHLRQRQLTQKTKIPLVQNISQNWTMPIIYTPTNSGGVEIIFSLVWPSLLPPVRRFSTLQPSELLETKSVVIPYSNPHKTFPLSVKCPLRTLCPWPLPREVIPPLLCASFAAHQPNGILLFPLECAKLLLLEGLCTGFRLSQLPPSGHSGLASKVSSSTGHPWAL